MDAENLSGIGFLALNGTRRASGSQVSLLAEISPESLAHYSDDKHWSWTALRNTFNLYDLKDLFKHYARRIQNAYFNVYLLLQVAISLIYMIGITIVNEENIEVVIPEVTVHVFIMACCIIIFCNTFDESLFKFAPWTQILLSSIIVLMILCADLGLTLYFYVVYNQVRTASAFQTLIIIYFFLPLPRKYQPIILGVIVSVSHLLVSGLLHHSNSHLVSRILADFIYYSCGNVIGIYAQLMNEVTIRRAFLDRRGHIKSTIKKNFEKGQEEHLLLSILPSHISMKVKEELVCAIKEIEESQKRNSNGGHNNGGGGSKKKNQQRKTIVRNQHGVIHKKPFSNLYVGSHNNVTILYADIVNFTPLTVKLNAEELVETLNELFGRFDEAAAKHNCLRIKLLGDCYYCVSGLPDPTPDHAKNCIEFGFDMIEIIRDIREKLKVDLAMRIGVHSGSILSGIIGIYKWHFDIWSKDTLIANHMEQAGRPGRIHITRVTKEILENGEGGTKYRFTPDNGKARDKFLAENNIETFLIVPPNKSFKRNRTTSTTSTCSNNNDETDIYELIEEDETRNGGIANGNGTTFKKMANGFGKRINTNLSSRKSDSQVNRGIHRKSFVRRATDVNGENLAILRNMFNEVNGQMEKAIEDMPIRKTDQWCGHQNFGETVNPLLLSFLNLRTETNYQIQPDPLFKFYILSALFILFCIGLIQAIIMPSDHIIIWIAFSLSAFFLIILLPNTWVSYLWKRHKDPHRELDSIPEPNINLIKFFYRISTAITNTWSLRIIIYLSVALILSTFAIIDVVDCKNENHDNQSDDCENPWYFTYSCTLALLGIFCFFRIHFLLKLLIAVISLAAYSLTMFHYRIEVFSNDIGASPSLDPEYSHVIYLVKIVLLLHIMDRQMEYINRLDYIWKKRLTHEHQEATRTHAINTILIYNILPMQIAKIYMDPNRREGHSRNYTDVSVMFASIPNFIDFYTENDCNEYGIRCLQILNEIIVEFDQALFNFTDVEKIKVIGSTYMAAAGLEIQETARYSVSSPRQSAEADYISILRERERNGFKSHRNVEPDLIKRRTTLESLVRYAARMMHCLEGINRDTFQNFQLRVGLDSGPIVAGVIGTSKPLYDIWGDCVNMASRMDTTGIPGKIQVGKNSANLLKLAGIKCEFRSKIKVKGKHQLIPTYFVALNDEFEIQYETIEDSSTYQPEVTKL